MAQKLTPAELEAIYAAKMLTWSDNRLRHELSYAENDSWATKEVMDAWNKCMAAEVERRLTAAV